VDSSASGPANQLSLMHLLFGPEGYSSTAIAFITFAILLASACVKLYGKP
jgi:hypothetical protein